VKRGRRRVASFENVVRRGIRVENGISMPESKNELTWHGMQITKLPSGFFEQSSPRVVS
jgi:hypothetical protein